MGEEPIHHEPGLVGPTGNRFENVRFSGVMNATSADIDRSGKTYVVLYWMPHEQAVGYNLYRSTTGTIPRNARPINGNKPIAPVSTCAELKAIIKPGTAEWQQLATAFNALQNRKHMDVAADLQNRGYFIDRTVHEAIRRRITIAPAPTEWAPIVIPWEIDPCQALERGLTDEEEAIFDTLANSNLLFRLARGLAFGDTKVIAGKKYTYELRGVMPEGKEVVLATGVTVTAGHFRLPDPPSGFVVTASDSKVLALWNRNPYAFSYKLYRSQHSMFSFQVIHEEPIQLDVERDLDGNEIRPRPGFLDFQRWDEDGLPVDHDVKGASISGPNNGTLYYYRVASVDILGREGAQTGPAAATPVCSIPPMAPYDVHVDPNTSPVGLLVSWRKVTRNVENHQILEPTQYYEIYRGATHQTLEDLDALTTYQVGTITANATDPTTPTLSWLDTDPFLEPPYGEQDFWYRVRCVDGHGNTSAPSAIISGRVPDTTPPGPTYPTGAEGFADHVRVFWQPNTEPDLAGYQIYRGICDRGVLYRPRPDDQDKEVTHLPELYSLGCDMVLVGAISLVEAQKRLVESGSIYFDDYSVPSESPLCYAFWVRAYDAAHNLYPGIDGCPASEHEYVCQRLYEETPPPAPVITALKARNNAVRVEWIASPIQDLRAFHVYRSDREDDEPEFIVCVLSDGTLMSDRWEGIEPSCGEIPAEPNPTSVAGSFLDKKVEPHRVYWYRVSALDWLGNESEHADLRQLPAISTFTFSCNTPPVPTLVWPVQQPAEGCGLALQWTPAFDAQRLEGFVVFRSSALSGDYRQVSPVVAGNTFNDMSARRGVDYWYRVQTLDKTGQLSPPSLPEKCHY